MNSGRLEFEHRISNLKQGKVLDVSDIDIKGRGMRTIRQPITDRSRKVRIFDLPIVSDNYDGAKIALDLYRSSDLYDYYHKNDPYDFNDYYHELLKLAIMFDNEQAVREILRNIDPRDNDNYVYHLVVNIGDQKYMDIIANDIAKRNWYEQQIYESGFKPLIGEHAPSREIYSYMKKL